MRIASAAALAAMPVALAAAAPASAYNTLQWYASGDEGNCWQAGTVGAPSLACAYTTAGYLPNHMLYAGGLGDFAPTGDYCNVYNTGSGFYQAIASDQSSVTGYQTPTPYSSYQWGDSWGNVCQAYGSSWGNEVRSGQPANECWMTCGMHHFASLGSHDHRPWGSQFAAPSLQVRTTFKPTTFTTTGPAGGWGYVCPILKDVTTGNAIEFCLETWQPMPADSQWPKTDQAGACNTANNNTFDTVHTRFGAGTVFATKEANTSDTKIGGTGSFSFGATISSSQWVQVVAAVRAKCNRLGSLNPQNWKLLGIEDGQEAWRSFTVLGGAHKALNVNTIY